MFGFVNANMGELTPEEKTRYSAVYCGVCRQLRLRVSRPARVCLQYDMTFLALLLMSLYEPEERTGSRACGFHPVKPRGWTDNEYIRYAADMNAALAYCKAEDDIRDEGSLAGRFTAGLLAKALPAIRENYPRQMAAITGCMEALARMEAEGCANPDEPAACFGRLMGELFVYREDLWAETLRELGMALGRFIYLADAAVDYRKDRKAGRYNPFLAMGTGEDWEKWEQYLVLTMGRCTEYFERLPLVQDKGLLDNILYSGVWVALRRQQSAAEKKGAESHDRRSI